MFWQYSVVLPGSMSRCVKKDRVSQTGMWVHVAPSCSACPQAVPPLLIAELLCYDLFSSTSTRPSSPSPDQEPTGPPIRFLCKRLEAETLYSMTNPTGERWLLTNLGETFSLVPRALQSAAKPELCPSRRSQHLIQRWPCCAADTSVQLDLRVGEFMIPRMKCSSLCVSFVLWESSLKLKDHPGNYIHTSHTPRT